MEKFSNDPTIINEVPEKEKKNSPGLPMWAKAAALSFGMAVSSPVFSQNTEGNQDKNSKNYETELMQGISSFYQNLSMEKEKSLNYLDYLKLSEEEKADFIKSTNNQITEYKKNVANPEKRYKEIIEETENNKSILISHFSSSEFLNKLESSLSKEDALLKQQKIIDNLKTVKIVVASPDFILKKSHTNSAAGVYVTSEHTVYIPFYLLMGGEVIEHELLHAAYRGDNELNEDDKNILHKLFKKNKKSDKAENEYQYRASERIVRKKILDLELEQRGIKKYDEKFTREHYKILQDLKSQFMLSGAAQDILKTITEKQLIELMNTIAYEDAKKDLESNTFRENMA